MARIGMHLRENAIKVRPGKAGVDLACEVLREGLENKKITHDQISIRELAESLVGPNWQTTLRKYQNTYREGNYREGIDAVDASGFSAITGQLFVDKVKEKYKLATFITDQIFTTIPVTNGNLDVQKVPYLSDVVDAPGVVQPQQPYPRTSFSAQYVTLAAPEKYGRICGVTWEMIFSDLTGQAYDSVASVGKRVGHWVESQRLKVAYGLTNNYSFNGSSYNTYLTAGGWINKLTDFTLTNWTSVNRLEQLLAQMLDPVTGLPIDVDGKQMVVMYKNVYTAKNILHATEVRSGNEASDTGNLTVAANPLEGGYELMASKHARQICSGTSPFTADAIADTAVLFGQLKKAFYWREALPINVVQAPPNSPAEFEQDVVIQVKANVSGVAGVYDPRYAVLAYNASAT